MISQKAYDAIKDYFNGDVNKIILWFKTINPRLGGITPMEMIRRGRTKKLEKFIYSALEGYGF